MENQLQESLAPVADSLAEFEEVFRSTITGDSGLAKEIANYLLGAPGKRLRPALVLLSHRTVSPDGPAALLAAVAIQLIHTATLLHDDVIDVSEKRRGRLSVNARWNNIAAVLMGDNLFARAFGVLVQLQNDRVLETVSAATKRVAIGELLQLQHNRNLRLKEDEYFSIIAGKTAALFGASCQAGRLQATDAPTDSDDYLVFGEALGMSFQIADDLLDYVGDPQKTGKATGNDLREGKITLPLIHALEQSSNGVREEMTSVISDYDPGQFDRVCDFIDQHQGFNYTRRKAGEMRDRAMNALNGVPASPYRRSLELIVDYSISRNV